VGPWDEPLRGRQAIRARFARAIARQEQVQFGHELLAVTPDGRGVARWWVSLHIPADGTVEEDEGIFLVTVEDEGLCTEFRE